MKRFGHVIPLFAGLAMLAPAASVSAQDTVFTLDPAQTKVEFSLGATLHTVHGSFQLKRGTVRFDEGTGKAEGELVVDATTAETGNGSRDSKMHKSVLESGRYPEIVFRPDRVEGKLPPQGASQIQLHGTFSLHGADHEMTVPVAIEAVGGQYKATAHFDVPYLKWGLKNPSTLLLRVSDRVEIEVHTVVRPVS